MQSGNSGTWADFEKTKYHGRTIFDEARALFIFDILGQYVPSLMDTNVNFGVVPYPKADEQEEHYYAGCGDGLVSVPNTTNDPERTGIIIEAMAYEGYKKIMPAYVQSTLQARNAADPECSELMT